MWAALRSTVVSIEQMIAHPDGVEAGLFSGTRNRQQLWPTHHPLYLWELNPDAEWFAGGAHVAT
jgi:hypothetical protein